MAVIIHRVKIDLQRKPNPTKFGLIMVAHRNCVIFMCGVIESLPPPSSHLCVRLTLPDICFKRQLIVKTMQSVFSLNINFQRFGASQECLPAPFALLFISLGDLI